MFISKKRLEESFNGMFIKFDELAETVLNKLLAVLDWKNQYEECKECGGLFNKEKLQEVSVVTKKECFNETFVDERKEYYCKNHKKNYSIVDITNKDGKSAEKHLTIKETR